MMAKTAGDQEIQPLVYSIGEVSVLLGISRSSAERLIREGSIPSLRLGARRRVVPKTVIDKMLRVGPLL